MKLRYKAGEYGDYMTTLLYDYYIASVKDALKNLEGEDLEKCLTALNNFMKNFGEPSKPVKEILEERDGENDRG